MKNLLFILLLLIGIYGYSQVSITNDGTLPDNSAMLDVKSSAKGMLIPRTSSSSRLAIANPAKGLILYDTITSSFWYYNASSWKEITTGSNGWNLTGNSATDSSVNFIGTTDEKPLFFRVNNVMAGEIHPTSGNVFLGLGAGQANTGGQSNTAFGGNSLLNNIGGSFNTANGFYSLSSNISGTNNTANGSYALYNNDFGTANTAIGKNALLTNTAGNFNTASGADALFSNTTGSKNSANGYESLYSNIYGIHNTADGYWALHANTAGNDNSATGSQALYNNILGNYNTADGFYALYNNSSGTYNTAVGYYALNYNATGNGNTAIGNFSGTTGSFDNTVSIGNNGWLNAGSNQAFIGNASTAWIGGWVGWSVYSDARIKNNIKEDVVGLDFITRLRPVTYHRSIKAMTEVTGNRETEDYPEKYDVEKVKYSGFLAQEVEQAARESGYDFSGIQAPKNNKDLYSLSYEQFVVPLVKAVQEQQQEIEELKAENAQLKELMMAVESKLSGK
jgi:trimeric autotransporter adhesin